jgi:hypothetical protein
MANPAKITVRQLAANGRLALPAADVIDTTGIVPILGADTGARVGSLVLEVLSTSAPHSITVLRGDNPPAVRQPLGDLLLNCDAVRASLATALAGADNDLVFTAVNGGVSGNAITVKYTDAGAGQALAVGVVGTDIDVTLETDGGGVIQSTAADIATEIAATPAAAALVTAALVAGETGAGVVTAMVQTPLAGGASASYILGPFDGSQLLQDDGSLQLSCVVVAGQTMTVRCYQAPKAV